MHKKTLLTLACLLLACAAGRAQVAAGNNTTPLARSRQLIVVTTGDWAAVRGTLRRFERKGGRGVWRQVGGAFPVVVGRGGLGWGEGLTESALSDGLKAGGGPSKREGDGRAPAGVFPLGPAFGFADARDASWLKLPYTPLAPTTECVDDVASRHYNRIVDRGTAGAVDWKSSEHMREVEGYRWGLVVGHNAAPPAPGRGSCIFLHVWAGPEKGTAGCTAMEQSNLEGLLRWLDARKRPLLVQLPEQEYARLRTSWRLPPLSGGK